MFSEYKYTSFFCNRQTFHVFFQEKKLTMTRTRTRTASSHQHYRVSLLHCYTVTLLHYDFQFCYIKSEMKFYIIYYIIIYYYIIYNIKVFFIMGGDRKCPS